MTGKQIFLSILIFILIFILLGGMPFLTGKLSNKYEEIIVKENMDIKRENFEHNKSHVHGMIEDLAKYKLELARTENATERKAIIAYIQENYATFDGNLIENSTLREFYYDVMNGRIE